MNSFKTYFLILIFGISFHCLSQTNNEPKPLTEILKALEAKFDVKFSYADDVIKSISIEFPESLITLNAALEYLELKTQLKFNQLNSRFIAVKKLSSENKVQEVQLQKLDEVFIENYLTRGLAKKIDGTVEISPQDFGILPGLTEPDVLQTIQTLPGITSIDERISNINIRGGTNDQNLFLYDGIRMYQTGHFFGLISAFNPYLTEQVNISVNGTKAKYGNGISGVINILNSDTISEDSTSGAGFNLISVDGFSKFQLSKNMELQVSARRSYTDALLTPTYDSYFERIFNNSELGNNQTSTSQLQQNERFFFYDANIKLLYDINDKSKIIANAITIFNQLDYDVNPTNTSTELATESELNQKSYAASLGYQYNWSKSVNMSAQLYYSNYQLFGNNLIPSTTQELIQKNEVIDIGARIDFIKALDKNLNLNFGYQFNEIGVSNLEDVSIPRFRSFVKEVIKTHNIYTEAEFTSNSKNTYGRIGLRGNYIDKFDELLFEPRLAFSQKFLNNFRLEILGETRSQTITQIIDLQQDFFGIEKRRWRLADNSNVPIVKSNQFSVGLNYKKNGWLVSVEGFVKNVSGISSRSQSFQNQFQFVNEIGDYDIKGIDFLLNKRIKNFNSWLSYSYSTNDFTFENLNNTFPSNIDIRHLVSFSNTYEFDNLKLSAGINWHSGRPYTQPLPGQINPKIIAFDTPNGERLPNYARIDISAIYDFQFAENVHAEVGASIWNVLDKENIINRFFTLDANDNIVQNDELALGLTPNFSLRLKF
ncbi:TonB-dependent receptor plug domain-containing protein [Winogradskyella sp.]|uniref:TonB-dependent receptor plug domain-containing protein n=1 Tax=Winogradskyella sp. TaxID=1883156 RepID=UPI0025E74A97|nr:TonB-dependent receptor plug domain-containing protein [Winogradskyella sp.]